MFIIFLDLIMDHMIIQTLIYYPSHTAYVVMHLNILYFIVLLERKLCIDTVFLMSSVFPVCKLKIEEHLEWIIWRGKNPERLLFEILLDGRLIPCSSPANLRANYTFRGQYVYTLSAIVSNLIR